MDKDSKNNQEVNPGAEPHTEVALVGELVRRLCVAKSSLSLYSFEHSVTQKNLEETWRFIQEFLASREDVSLDIYKNTILFEGLPIEERNPMVEQLARDFRNLRVRGITFHQGVTLKEVAIFFKMLTLSREVLEEHDGASGLLKELEVTHVGVNQARYIRLEEDQKVVSASFKGEISNIGETDSKKELLSHLWDALMAQKVDREWLLEEIRSDPSRAAAQIVGLMKYYDNMDALEDREKQQEAMQSLLSSVQVLGLRLAERDKQGENTESETLAASLVQLERELKARSAGLRSSRAASRFIQEITNTVTAFIDSHHADRIAKEFLRDEKGLKRTEQLLKEMVDSERDTAVAQRLREIINEKGLDDDQLNRLIDNVQGKKTQKKTSTKRRRKRATKPVREKIAKALSSIPLGEEGSGATAEYLAGVFEREMSQRVANEKDKRLEVEQKIACLDEALNSAGLGLVVFGSQGEIILITGWAHKLAGLSSASFDPEFLEFLGSGEYKTKEAAEAFLKKYESGSWPEKILNSLQGVMTGTDGRLLGLMLSPPEKLK